MIILDPLSQPFPTRLRGGRSHKTFFDVASPDIPAEVDACSQEWPDEDQFDGMGPGNRSSNLWNLT